MGVPWYPLLTRGTPLRREPGPRPSRLRRIIVDAGLLLPRSRPATSARSTNRPSGTWVKLRTGPVRSPPPRRDPHRPHPPSPAAAAGPSKPLQGADRRLRPRGQNRPPPPTEPGSRQPTARACPSCRSPPVYAFVDGEWVMADHAKCTCSLTRFNSRSACVPGPGRPPGVRSCSHLVGMPTRVTAAGILCDVVIPHRRRDCRGPLSDAEATTACRWSPHRSTTPTPGSGFACVLVFTGSTREAQAEADAREAKRTEGRGVDVSSWVDQAKDRLDGGAAERTHGHRETVRLSLPPRMGPWTLILASPPFLAAVVPACGSPGQGKGRTIGGAGPARSSTRARPVGRVAAGTGPHGSIAVELGDRTDGDDENWPGGRSRWRWFPSPAGSPRLRRNPIHRNRRHPLAGGRCAMVPGRRPNPPVGALGDKFRPNASDMVIVPARRASGTSTSTPSARRATERKPAARATAPGQKPKGCLDTVNAAGPLDWWGGLHWGYSGSPLRHLAPASSDPSDLAMCPQRVCTVCGNHPGGSWRSTER